MEKFVEKIAVSSDLVFVGIDPGAEGAIGFLCGNHVHYEDIPTYKTERAGKKSDGSAKTKTLFDHGAIVELFKEITPYRNQVRICVEEAQVQIKGKGANAYTAFRVGVGFGMWPLFLTACGFSLEVVAPRPWKMAMGLAGKDKEYSRMKAASMFPTVKLTRKADHNRAEALLLAEYLRRKVYGAK